MKRFGFFMSLLVASSFFLAGCGSSSSTPVSTDTPQTIAIDKITAYAEDQTQPVPTVEDFEDAGVVGVTTDNLDEINALVAELEAEDVDSPEKIQAILDDAGLGIVDPTDPEDTVAPVITVTGDNPATVTLGATYTDAGATATDNVDPTVTVTSSGTVDTNVLGDYTITYSATDVAGNTATATRTVTVIESVEDDTEAPVITVTGDNPAIVMLGTTYTDAGATATDNVDPTVTITSSGTVDTNTLGNYTITYSATDVAGNTATAMRTVTVTDGTVDLIVGQTVEFDGTNTETYSFYKNAKFVKTTCSSECTNGTGTFTYIGTWSGSTSGTDASGLVLKDDTGADISVATISDQQVIYHFPVIDNKDLPNNVQGDAIREKHANGSITFVYFRDPDAWGDRAFSGFGFDTVAWATTGGGGHWEIRDGRVYAFNGIDVTSEIATYAFDRQPVKDQGGPIVTVTSNDGDLMSVIVTDEYWQLKPPATIDKTVEVATPAVMTVEAVAGKLMLITDKADGPSACYFETPLEVGVNGYVVCAGVSIDGTTLWGGRGDNWFITDGNVDMKLHELSPEPPSTLYTWKFEDANPGQGTLVSKYDSGGNFITTSSLSRFQDF